MTNSQKAKNIQFTMTKPRKPANPHIWDAETVKKKQKRSHRWRHVCLYTEWLYDMSTTACSSSSVLLHITAQQHDQPGKGRVTHCFGKHGRWWLLYLLAYLDLFPHVISGWLSWLVDIGRKKGFGLTEAPNFMILMVFWPQSSLIIHQKPGKRLSGIDYVFTKTRGTGTIKKQNTVAARVALCYVLLNRTCIFIFCWMEESQIYTWICLPSDSFVALGENFFSQDSCGCVWGV